MMSKKFARLQRQKIIIEGIVQGVGFRPFIYLLAHRFQLTGSVCNDTRGVTIEVEGDHAAVSLFLKAVRDEKPPLAVIQSLHTEQIKVQGDHGFVILKSSLDESRRAQVSPDTFVCEECLRELFDPADRRYRYPFINCTNCGPRYTIVTGIPYDRPLTTMADFPLCTDCQNEYDDPASRRFHAQPNACPVCGPRLQLCGSDAQPLIHEDPLREAIDRLRKGEVLAVKGLGGYHLAVDAKNQQAVLELRRRKNRDEKPFALMLSDLQGVHKIARVNVNEEKLLSGPERPIVLLEKMPDHGLAEAIAPDNRYFGVMLPYTPLHYLLLQEEFEALVMTSANLSDEPIAYEDDEAMSRLAGIADAFLVHDRRIFTRADDSIARVMADRPLLLRRSRGFVPRSLTIWKECPPILAVGAELKNTVCVTRGDQAFLSQHIGDLKNLEVYGSFRRTIQHLQKILEISPAMIAHDEHPDYYSTHYALEESGLEPVAVQHHHAHLASCLAEHGETGPAIGVVFDGIGYGTDGNIWGGEFLVGDLQNFDRAGHFKYLPMPGGDLATRQPWRMGLSYLLAAGMESEIHGAFKGIPEKEKRLVLQATRKGINAPLASSCGRLFDAVASLLGLRQVVSFEGQAAMQLEMHADPGQRKSYPDGLCEEDDRIIFDPIPLMIAILQDIDNGVSTSVIAGRFHRTLAEMITEVCKKLRQRTSLQTVVLSGGVFQNCLLTEMTVAALEGKGFSVLTHSLVPPNDGGLALGQAAVAATRSQG